MADLIINLSGKSGLANYFAGDADMVTPQPNLRLMDENQSFVMGLFNPYLRDGYLAPITTTTTTVTLSESANSQFTAVEYDHSSGEVILLDDVNKIYKLTSLTDTSAELVQTLGTTNDFGTFAYEELYDAQIYEVNAVRKLFVVGKSLPYDGQSVEFATTTGTASVVGTFAVNPSSTTKPSVLYTTRSFTASPGTSNNLSVTVPSGTNTCLFVICFFSNTYNPAYIYNYGDSALMTDLGEAGTAGGPGFIAAYYPNPSTGTYNVQVVGPAGGFTNLTMFAFVTDQTHQTYPVSFDSTRPTSQLLTAPMGYVNTNQMGVVAMYSNGIISLSDDVGEQEGATQAYGSDYLVTYDIVPTSGLMIGALTLPVISNDGVNETWLASRAAGSFAQELVNNYAFMRLADNGFAYVFADNKVHKIDGGLTGGTNGTITENVLIFPDHFMITDALDYRSRMYIAVHQYAVNPRTTSLNNYTGKCGLYVWNRISTQLSAADFIELPGVREIKRIFASPDGVLKLLVISDNGLTELRMFGYNDSGSVVFPTVKKLGIGAYPQLPDGLTTAGDKTIWLGNDGNLYCEKGNSIVQLFQAKAPGVTSATLATNITSGIVFYGSGSETATDGFRANKQGILVSYDDSSTAYTRKIYPFDLKIGDNSSQTPNAGNVYTGVTYLPQHSVLRNVRVYNAPVVGTGTTEIATVKLYFNQSTTVGMTKTITKDEAKRGYVDFKINKPYTHALQIEIEWSTSIALDGDVYLPNMAVVSYDETSAQSPDNG